MLLAIDIGNTSSSFAIFRGRKLIRRFELPTAGDNFSRLKQYLKKNPVSDIVICSVVPQETKRIKRELGKLINRPMLILGKNCCVPIKNLYRYPRQVGQDRLANAYAGTRLYNAPLIVVDFGTAITFDVISSGSEYLGGMILPGLKMSLDALAENTALLPKIKLASPGEFIGRDTKNSMLSGIIYGVSLAADSLIKKIKNRIGRNAMVISTGGNAKFISRYCQHIDKVNPDLTLKGLNLIFIDPAAHCRLDSAAHCRRIK